MKNYVLYMSGARNQQVYIKPEVSGFYINNLDLNVNKVFSNINTTGTIVASNIIYNTGNNNISGTLTANNLVYNTGNQTISGIKTFANDMNVSGTGTFNGLNLENINSLTLSGMNINITGNSVLNIFNDVKISGNSVLTGISDGDWASQNELDSLSGSLNLSGNHLESEINSLSGYINSSESNIVFTTGNQNISGNKTFTNNIIYSVSPRISGVNFTPDADLYTFFDYILTGSSTLNAPNNMVNGESITIFLNQDASGSRNMAFDNAYLFSNGINPTLNFVPSGVDVMQVIRVNNRYFCSFASNY